MEIEERKSRILYGQHLTNQADAITVCKDLNGIQAQFMSTALHAILIRTKDWSMNDTSELVKNWSVRGTVHIFAKEDLSLYLYENRTHYLRPVDQMVEDEFISLERKQLFADIILQGVADGIDEREALKELCFSKGMTETECNSIFNSWGGTIRYLAETGKICYKVQEKKAFELCEPFAPMSEDAARLEMVRRYFTNFGPATVNDAAYYFGVPKKQVKEWLNKLPIVNDTVNGKEVYWINHGNTDFPEVPKCIFLAGFDQLMLGYEKKESIFLPQEHLRGIFNLAGIVMPAILLHGEVVGRWKRKNDSLIFTLFRRLDDVEKKVISQAAEKQWNVIKKLEWE